MYCELGGFCKKEPTRFYVELENEEELSYWASCDKHAFVDTHFNINEITKDQYIIRTIEDLL